MQENDTDWNRLRNRSQSGRCSCPPAPIARPPVVHPAAGQPAAHPALGQPAARSPAARPAPAAHPAPGQRGPAAHPAPVARQASRHRGPGRSRPAAHPAPVAQQATQHRGPGLVDRLPTLRRWLSRPPSTGAGEVVDRLRTRWLGNPPVTGDRCHGPGDRLLEGPHWCCGGGRRSHPQHRRSRRRRQPWTGGRAWRDWGDGCGRRVGRESLERRAAENGQRRQGSDCKGDRPEGTCATGLMGATDAWTQGRQD